MAWNVSGLYERLYNWVTDRDGAVPINATKMDAETDGIVDAINDIVQQNQPFLGEILGVDGDATLPGYTFADDTNTGLYRAGADSLALSVGGAAALTIASGGGVTVGGLTATTAGVTTATVTTSNITTANITTGNVTTLVTDTVTEASAAAGVTIDGLLIKDAGLPSLAALPSLAIATSQITSGTLADARVAESNITQHEAAISIAASQITSGTLADALVVASNVTQHQAAVSIAASQVASGTLADARIAESNVTQHQAALALAASQVASGTFDDARIAESSVVQWETSFYIGAGQITSGTLANARIAQSNVTQHQAALSITESQISDLQAYLTSVPTASAANIWAGTGSVFVTPSALETASEEVTLTDAATVALDWSSGANFVLTLGGNRTLGAPTNEEPGTWRTIRIVQDGTGSRTLAFHSEYKFAGGVAPTLTTTAGAEDVLFIYSVSGTKHFVFAQLDFS